MNEMKIGKLFVENYGSLKNVELEFNGNSNIFIGKNNSGKSTVIDVIMFISEMALHGSVQNLLNSRGGYKEVVFGKLIDNEITLNLEILLSEEDKKFIFSKLFRQDISFENFKNDVSSKIKYECKLINDKLMGQENLYIYVKNQEILYSRGFWSKDGSYSIEIVENFADGCKNGNWNFKSVAGGAPPTSILYCHKNHSPIQPEENLLLMLHNDFFSNFRKLNPVRESPETIGVTGEYQLSPDAGNLPKVLNTLASSKREVFDKIIKSVSMIIDETIEVRAPLKEGSKNVYLSITEKSFINEEFTWKHVASGTKEIIYLITLLHTTPKGSVLAIEELESHLHGDAISNFMSLINQISRDDDKQFILTTHSPILIDGVPSDKLNVVLKESGETKIVPLKEFADVDEILEQAGIPKSWILLTKNPSFIFIVTGRDDVKVWNQFFIKNAINPEKQKIRIVSSGSNKGGGFEKLIETGKFLQKIRSPIPFLLVEDSDNKKEEKEKKLKDEGFSEGEYHIFSEKEIEDYLLDPIAISKLTGKSIEEVEEVIRNSNGRGKEKLANIFKKLSLSKPRAETKELIVTHMDTIPEEISQIMNKVDEKLK